MSDIETTTNISGGFQSAVAQSVVIEQQIINLHRYSDRCIEEPVPIGAQPIPPCPYPGLSHFRPRDADLFFGRDAATDRLIAAANRQSLTALVGASGRANRRSRLLGWHHV